MLEHEEKEYDEHVWLSLKNAEIICQSIADTLGEIDPENKDTYEANVVAYIEELAGLDVQYQDTVDTASRKTVLFGDRFPFRYMVDDYGLNYYAAFDNELHAVCYIRGCTKRCKLLFYYGRESERA